MAALKTGDYTINFYAADGGQLKHFRKNAESLFAGIDYGAAFVSEIDNTAVSFTIERRIFNSLDNS